MRSIMSKWIMSLLLTSVVSVLLVGFVALRTTESEFNRFVNDQALAEFVTAVEFYYGQNGSLDAFDEWLADAGRGPQFGPRRRAAFGLLNATGDVILRGDFQSSEGRDNGSDRRSPSMAVQRVPITVDGQTIAIVISDSAVPPLDPLAAQFVARTTTAMWIGIAVAVVLAVVLGIWLARSLTKPLRELTATIAAMHPGELGRQVAVRTRDEIGDLAQAFNRMSSDLARSNQLRKQMTADIAHELRTPLTVINGYLEGLRDGTLKPTAQRFDTMYQEAALLQHLIEDLRTLSLADAGELTLNRQRIAPTALLLQVAQAFQPMAEQQAVRLQVDVEQDLPQINVDRERMIQVLSNLVSNALRYTPFGGTITLLAQRTSSGVCLIVRDTGSGISPEKLPHIFERFYRADEARHQEDGSESGLGLAIVRSIVVAHGGSVSAESTLGEGTTMRLDLPV